MTETRSLELCPACCADGLRRPGPLAVCVHGLLRPTERRKPPFDLDADLDEVTRHESSRKLEVSFDIPEWIYRQAAGQLPWGMRSALVSSLLFEATRMAAALGGAGSEEADRFLWLLMYGRFRFVMLPPGGPLKHWEEIVKAFTRVSYDATVDWQPFEDETAEEEPER